MIETLHLAGASIELHPDGLTITRFPNGRKVDAVPGYSPEDKARAKSLGYGFDLLAMSREHEVGHSLLAHLLGLPHSPTLRGVADGKFWPHWHAEECAVLGLQRFARMAGVDLVEVARRISGDRPPASGRS